MANKNVPLCDDVIKIAQFVEVFQLIGSSYIAAKTKMGESSQYFTKFTISKNYKFPAKLNLVSFSKNRPNFDYPQSKSC